MATLKRTQRGYQVRGNGENARMLPDHSFRKIRISDGRVGGMDLQIALDSATGSAVENRMKAHFWAIILILVCGLNSLGLCFSFSGIDAHGGSFMLHGITSPNRSIKGAISAKLQPVALVAKVASDCSRDCGENHGSDNHHCHLGHCQFIVGVQPKLCAPDVRQSATSTPCLSYRSVSLATRKKPPQS